MRSIGKGSALGLLCGLLVAGAAAGMADSTLAAELPVATDARLGGDEARPAARMLYRRSANLGLVARRRPYRTHRRALPSDRCRYRRQSILGSKRNDPVCPPFLAAGPESGMKGRTG